MLRPGPARKHPPGRPLTPPHSVRVQQIAWGALWPHTSAPARPYCDGGCQGLIASPGAADRRSEPRQLFLVRRAWAAPGTFGPRSAEQGARVHRGLGACASTPTHRLVPAARAPKPAAAPPPAPAEARSPTGNDAAAMHGAREA
ncbi:hypothetical protein NDU88_004538 [Pleurodeles waltl]|uniref:Uncharacterized protein n=1 Tax=Pleurodeles waltl TaxID=8319 RepID=A0AAV7PG34_PLEWA|nr:hypothetical protein NDU88_004538 [Pleurodeles waltl]